jgi:UDP-N-acetylmuramoyl-tripeptide--D-alanyl-D-alanine ligase
MNTIENIYQIFSNCQQVICTDTRKIVPNALFFALKGDNFNGNLFAQQALELGAKYAIVDEITVNNENFILVDDVLKTLQQLANYHRKQCKAIILGIGGSNGKTTTKELISAILQTEKNIHFTHGNLNNHIGVPLTLLQIKAEHEIAVIELGANHIGDIKELCEIAEPNMGIITNIGKEHLEGFGSIEGVAQAESELYDYLIKTNGLAFVNTDDTWLNNMSKRIVNKIDYSIRNINNNEQIDNVKLVPSIAFEYQNKMINSPLMGAHNLQNIAAAISIAQYFKIALNNILLAIGQYAPTNNRSQIIQTEKGNTILLDAYNANPSSVQEAINTFSQMPQTPKIIILGDMFELGNYAEQEHLEIINQCIANEHIFRCILVGDEFAKHTIESHKIMQFKNKIDALHFIEDSNISHSAILIKGSRGMKMEDFKALL